MIETPQSLQASHCPRAMPGNMGWLGSSCILEGRTELSHRRRAAADGKGSHAALSSPSEQGLQFEGSGTATGGKNQDFT